MSKRWVIWTAAAVTSGALVVGACNAWILHRGTPIYETAEQLPDMGVALVLGARVHADGRPFPALADRLHAALDAYRAGRVSKILVSGDHGQVDYDEVHGMASWLVDHGVKRSAIYLDHAGFRTLDSAYRAAEIFGVKRVVVCTQRYHLPRAIYLLEAAGIEAVGLVADRRVYLKARRDAVRETLARVKAVLDVHVLGTRPRFGGPKVPMDAPAHASYATEAGASSD